MTLRLTADPFLLDLLPLGVGANRAVVLVPAKATGRGPHKIQFEVRPDDTEGMPLEEKTIFIVP